MLLETAEKYPLKTRFYLERYVNDGSPSGFTLLYRSSPHTDPFGFSPWFNLNLCKVSNDCCETYGEIPSWPYPNNDNWIFLHPDLDIEEFDGGKIDITVFDSHRVTPTSSTRTVQFMQKGNNDYVKLHFDGILGRVNRTLPFKKAISGPEIYKELKDCLGVNGILPNILCLLPETGARIIKIPSNGKTKEIGMIWRQQHPYGARSKEIAHIWPLFSLFSTDRLSPIDPYLLVQLIANSNFKPAEYILEKIIFPVVDCYMNLIIKLGYQIECNAQNIMVGLNNKLELISLVIRDIGRFEKDLTIRKSLNLKTDYESFPYKCISADNELYQIRHSFAFDFKFVEYIINPIIKIIIDEFGIAKKPIIMKIRDYIKTYLIQLPDNYFPSDGKWYKHDRILLVKERPYIGIVNPVYR